jgi:ABC-type Fe3+ transport system substrate-binding protein
MLVRLIIAVVLVALAVPARAESVDALYQKAKGEGTLVLYGGGPAANYEPMARAFEQRFPGVKVAVTGGFSNVLNAQVESQVKAGKLEVDMAIFQTVQDFVHWNRRGIMLRFKPDDFDKIAKEYKDKDGAWIAVNVSPLFYAYNTEHLAPADVPKSALDFLKPRFRGKLITAYPADDDATLYVFDTIVRKYGWKYMDRYMANQPNFIQGHLGVARSIAAGDRLATFDATVSTSANIKKQGGKLEILPSPQDPTPIFTASAGIFKGAPHPNAAKLYLTWLLAKEQQSHTGFYSPRRDLGPPAGLPPLSQLHLANRYLQFVTDDKQLMALRKRFEAYTGPIKNAGGVR